MVWEMPGEAGALVFVKQPGQVAESTIKFRLPAPTTRSLPTTKGRPFMKQAALVAKSASA